jgi:hypothetical protein
VPEASFVLTLSMMLSRGTVGFCRLFVVLSGHVVFIFWHQFTSPFALLITGAALLLRFACTKAVCLVG